ncbi:unnamed protein product [Paramecium sonneborni]|uniref:WD40-repeat-containing domain n=1 Tax=Paramecium sonneborni TaxID=65129 RepID=A0A8S1RVD0_9CILI|nr:unnamed protein product [Paramecium sonneborni]
MSNEKCQEHQEEIVAININEQTNQKRGLCTKCLINKYNNELIHVQDSIEKINQAKQQVKEERSIQLQINLQNINKLSETVQELKNFYIQQIDKINSTIKKWSQSIQNGESNFINKVKSKQSNDYQVFIKFIKEEENNMKLYQSTFQMDIYKQIQSLIETDLIKKCFNFLDKTQIIIKIIEQQDQKQQEFKSQQLNPFTYNLIQKNSIKQTEWCGAIAFNKDNSIVLVGCESKIKVFEFKQEQLKQTQLLKEHSKNVNTLNFMKKSSQFISGSEDSSIIIWSMNENNQWICKQKINGHSSYIYCLILNNNEDIIISGSADKKIKFWMEQNEWKCSQTITDHTSNVYGLSMNDQQNKVISCSGDKLILIIEQSSKDQKWNVVQNIKVEQFGNRICFMNDDVFTFQPVGKEYMHIYEINNTNKQYSKTKDIVLKSRYQDYNCLFPQQYIKQKCLLVNKNADNINLIRTNQNGHFITEQSIDFGTYNLFGSMSDNGDYLITWDEKSQEIQIRKYQEK